MRILVFSSTALSSDNNIGNSMINIFEGVDGDLEFASLYCRPQQPNNPFHVKYFQITEKLLLKNLRDKSKPTGVRVWPEEKNAVELDAREQRGFDQARKMRWMILFWARDILWKIGRWKSKELQDFLDECKPDVIFMPIYYPAHLNRIAWYLHAYTGAPMVGYIADDFYTLRQFRLSPLYWIDRLINRRNVKKTIEQCDVLYVISDIQKQEYEKIFSRTCKILTKSADFSSDPPVWERREETMKLIYAGNLGEERWASLGMITQAVEKLRKEGYALRMDIYSATPMTKAMLRKLRKDGCMLHEPVPYAQIIRLQQEADVLIHAEGLSLKSRMAVHQSFSTKLVDYFAMGKCIFAVGTLDVASIHHLRRNDAAVIAERREDVYRKLKELLEQPELLAQYGEKAYLCGRKHHDNKIMKTMLSQDLKHLAGFDKSANIL